MDGDPCFLKLCIARATVTVIERRFVLCYRTESGLKRCAFAGVRSGRNLTTMNQPPLIRPFTRRAFITRTSSATVGGSLVAALAGCATNKNTSTTKTAPTTPNVITITLSYDDKEKKYSLAVDPPCPVVAAFDKATDTARVLQVVFVSDTKNEAAIVIESLGHKQNNWHDPSEHWIEGQQISSGILTDKNGNNHTATKNITFVPNHYGLHSDYGFSVIAVSGVGDQAQSFIYRPSCGQLNALGVVTPSIIINKY